MANIVLGRVDFRLIHGQVVTRWIKLYPAKEIVIVDDILGDDPFMADIYEMSAPQGIKVSIFHSESAKKKIDAMNRDVFLLTKNIETMEKLVSTGLSFSKLIVGGVPSDEGKKFITNGVYLGEEDITLLKNIDRSGIKTICQATPEDTEITIEKAEQKLNS